jgi:hypothetical protein
VHWTIGRIDRVSLTFQYREIWQVLNKHHRHAEEDPTILGSEDEPVEILAFCTGLLPAAAVVAARDTSELIALSSEIVAITLRMSVAIQQRLMIIENSDLSWATTLVGATPGNVQGILDDFHETKVSPPRVKSRLVLCVLLHTFVGSKSICLDMSMFRLR